MALAMGHFLISITNFLSCLLNFLTVDLRSTAARYTQTIVIPRVPMLRFLLPKFQPPRDEAHVTPDSIRLDVRLVVHYGIIFWHSI